MPIHLQSNLSRFICCLFVGTAWLLFAINALSAQERRPSTCLAIAQNQDMFNVICIKMTEHRKYLGRSTGHDVRVVFILSMFRTLCSTLVQLDALYAEAGPCHSIRYLIMIPDAAN